MSKLKFILFLLLFNFIILDFPLGAEENDFTKIIPENHGEFYSNSNTTFHGTNSRTTFRVWFPISSDRAWQVLIDTNNWKKVHPSDYTDSRTLDKNQFDLVKQKKPDSVKAFYELAGAQIFPSTMGRDAGKEWIGYNFQRFHLPWPLHDRWTVMKIKNDETKALAGRYRYDYELTVGNFKALKGYWELLPLPEKPGWTEFRGQYDSDPGIFVPQFLGKTIFKAAIKRNAKENLEVMKKINRMNSSTSPLLKLSAKEEGFEPSILVPEANERRGQEVKN